MMSPIEPKLKISICSKFANEFHEILLQRSLF